LPQCLAKIERSTKQFYIHMSKNNKPHVMSFCLLICFFLPDAEVFVTSLRYLVCCVSHAFQLWR